MALSEQVRLELDGLLRAELIPAAGCTEPIAVAYAGALARATLGRRPERVEVGASGSLLKNVKSVVVPNTGGGRGMEMAVAAGIVAGDETKELEVLAGVGEGDIEEIRQYASKTPISIRALTDGPVFDLQVRAFGGDDEVFVRIAEEHTKVVRLERNGQVLREAALTEAASDAEGAAASAPKLSMPTIWAYATENPLSKEVREVLLRQARNNLAIAREGLKGDYGANIGRVLLESYGDAFRTRAPAWAAAGADARMSGCEMPVIINSGSGNQGIAIAVPVALAAQEKKAGEADLCKALALANLTAIHVKEGIGRLSAFCGAVSAAAGAAAGMAWLGEGTYHAVIHAVVNTLAMVSGMVCDGAKASCAAKVAMAIDAAQLACQMGKFGKQFYGGEGLVTRGVEATISNIARLARDGMKETNEEIIRIMTGC